MKSQLLVWCDQARDRNGEKEERNAYGETVRALYYADILSKCHFGVLRLDLSYTNEKNKYKTQAYMAYENELQIKNLYTKS